MILIVGGSFQGKRRFAESFLTCQKPDVTIVNDFHRMVWDWLAAGKDPQSETEQFYQEHKAVVIICNEVGSGVVPMEQKEREYREAVGRCGCYLAQKADQVYRVLMGIGTRIK